MTINCKLNITKSMGSASFTYKYTTVYCVLSNLLDRPSLNFQLEVRFFDSNIINHKPIEKYYSYLIKEILSLFVCADFLEYKALFVDFYAINTEFRLMCSINAALLAFLEAGIPIKKSFYAINKNKCIIYAEEKVYEVTEDGNCEIEIEDIKICIEEAIKPLMNNLLKLENV